MSCAAARERAEERVLVGARPPGHEHADHREARHRERVEHTDAEVVDLHARPGGDHDEDQERRHHDDDRREREDAPVGLVGEEVFLLHELDAVTDELEPTVEPAGVHRAEPALHVAHHLQQEHVAEDERGERDEREHDSVLIASVVPHPICKPEDLDHRSMSPRMK